MFSIMFITVVGVVLQQICEVTPGKSYVNYRVVVTEIILDPTKIIFLHGIQDKGDLEKIQLMGEPELNKRVHILVCTESYNSLVENLEKHKIQYTISDDDLQALIDAERNLSPLMHTSGINLSFDRYHGYKDIYEYCKALESHAHDSGAVVTTKTIGYTVEGKDILLVKVTNRDTRRKPAIWMDGGMHAREWISIATVTFMLNKLVTGVDESTTKLLEAFDWYIVPVVNVDGYEFTRDIKDGDRLWRKNRRKNLFCHGVDLNRNFSFQYGGGDSSRFYCSLTYRGPEPLSEPETIAISQAILKRKEKIKMYLTFHSFSQLIMFPWGYTKKRPDDYDDLMKMAVIGKDAIEKNNDIIYHVGTTPELLYETSGSSDDWAKGVAGIKYSYTFELRDKGKYGLLLPPDQIKPCGEETFNGVKAMAMHLMKELTQNGIKT